MHFLCLIYEISIYLEQKLEIRSAESDVENNKYININYA